MKFVATKITITGGTSSQSFEKQDVLDDIEAWLLNAGIDAVKHCTARDSHCTQWEKDNTVITCNFRAK